MNQDKALKRALKKQEISVLPPDFNIHTMRKVRQIDIRRKKRIFIIQLCITSLLSIGLIAFSVYFAKNRLNIDFRFIEFMSVHEIRNHSFELYISFLALLLLMGDTFLRKKLKKKYGI